MYVCVCVCARARGKMLNAVAILIGIILQKPVEGIRVYVCVRARVRAYARVCS